jgi:hypothetical protein
VEYSAIMGIAVVEQINFVQRALKFFRSGGGKLKFIEHNFLILTKI